MPGLNLEEHERMRAGMQWAPPCLQGAGPGLATPVLEQVSGLGLGQKGTVGTARTGEQEGPRPGCAALPCSSCTLKPVAWPPPEALSNALRV